jgi:hypothetical protein
MFRTALDQLALLNVTGVRTHFAIDTVPQALRRGQLPALLVLPVEIQDTRSRLFPERGEGFEAVAFANGPRTTTFAVNDLLLVAPVAAGRGLQTHLPTLIDLIDSYFTALAADVTLGDTLLEPAHVVVESGRFAYGGTDYHGCAFRHRWVVGI